MRTIDYAGATRRDSRWSAIKYPLITAILGALISTSIYIFLVFIQRGYYEIKWQDRDGVINMMEFGLHALNIFRDAVWPGLCFIVGLTLFVTGIVHVIKAGRRMKIISYGNGNRGFAIAYVCLGVIFLAALGWYQGWLEPNLVSFKNIVLDDGRELTVYRDPVWIWQLIAWKVINFLMGAAVIGMGILQLKSEISQRKYQGV